MALNYEKCKVLHNEQITETVWLLQAQWDKGAKCGQFFMLRAWDKTPLLSRPISVHNYDAENYIIEFLYEVRGTGTEIFTSLNEGDYIELTGALGNGFDIESLKGKVAVVGGGIGIAPLYYLVKSLAQKGCKVDFYAGFRDEPYCIDKFASYAKNVFVASDSGNFGVKGFVTDLIKCEEYTAVLTCGPLIMMEKLAKMAMAKSVPVFVSKESNMACGIGACLGCTCKTVSGAKSVCKDGPVFKGEDLYA